MKRIVISEFMDEAAVKRASSSVLDPWSEQLRLWLVADSRRSRRERRTATQMQRKRQRIPS